MTNNSNNKNFFITFEGLNGSGKTTQVKLLHEKLKNYNISSIITKEPNTINNIKKILLQDKQNRYAPETEFFLYCADRFEHIKTIIIPELKNKWVLCDRFLDSSIAYQGIGLGANIDLINQINKIFLNIIKPDLTFILNININLAKTRVKARNLNKTHYYEEQNIKFYEQIQKAYISMSKTSKRFILINADNDEQSLSELIFHEISKKLLYNK